MNNEALLSSAPVEKKAEDVEKKPTQISDNSSILTTIKNLERTIKATNQETELLLEVEAQAAQGIDDESILSEFSDVFLKLPHFTADQGRKYLTELLTAYKTDNSVFMKKMADLTLFANNRRKDLEIIDSKFIVTKTKDSTNEGATK